MITRFAEVHPITATVVAITIIFAVMIGSGLIGAWATFDTIRRGPRKRWHYTVGLHAVIASGLMISAAAAGLLVMTVAPFVRYMIGISTLGISLSVIVGTIVAMVGAILAHNTVLRQWLRDEGDRRSPMAAVVSRERCNWYVHGMNTGTVSGCECGTYRGDQWRIIRPLRGGIS